MLGNWRFNKKMQLLLPQITNNDLVIGFNQFYYEIRSLGPSAGLT
jgi:hypothetical protein